MKYTDTSKRAVVTTDKNGNSWTVPRGHRFWAEWGIDKAEQEGRIGESEANNVANGAVSGGTYDS
ncbi:hypothetical protein [Vibrio cholerae]|uniref:hypothetical protein n=1 Tax=Vibrio cholerae TaxID=666 RepID=UPI001E2FA475|nr:hypothetical protein [Vibrio cholerae]MCD1241234.1 hypothetical protein [Vibrio cholerae]